MDYTIECVGDDEDRRKVRMREFHALCYLLADGSALVDAVDDILWQTWEFCFVKLLRCRLVLEEYDKRTSPFVEGCRCLGYILQSMIGRFLTHSYESGDEISASCLREKRDFRAIQLIKLRLCIEIANNSDGSRRSAKLHFHLRWLSLCHIEHLHS